MAGCPGVIGPASSRELLLNEILLVLVSCKDILGAGRAYAEEHAGGACEVWGGLQLGKSEQPPNLEMPGPHTAEIGSL